MAAGAWSRRRACFLTVRIAVVLVSAEALKLSQEGEVTPSKKRIEWRIKLQSLRKTQSIIDLDVCTAAPCPHHRKNRPLVWLTNPSNRSRKSMGSQQLTTAAAPLPSARAASSCLEPETETAGGESPAAAHPGSRGLCVCQCVCESVYVWLGAGWSSLFPRQGSGGDHRHEEVARSLGPLGINFLFPLIVLALLLLVLILHLVRLNLLAVVRKGHRAGS